MEKLPKEEQDFYIYMDKLNEIYDQNPSKASKAVRDALVKLNAIESPSVFAGVDIDKLVLGAIILLIAIMGFFNISNIPIYLFGIAFFLAGHFIGLYVDVFGLIFLFSHSVTGICVMEAALIGDILKNPLMSDNPRNIYIYLGINIAIFVIATFIVILHNLSHGFRQKNHATLIPLSMYAVGFLMSAILPMIFEYIYTL